MSKVKAKYRQGILFDERYVKAHSFIAKGEMLLEDTAKQLREKIPLNPLATPEMIAQLKHEKEPLDCIFSVEYKTGSNGLYADSAFESIVKQIITANPFIPACYGHQSQEAFYYEGRAIYGTVIGALLNKEEGKIHYRIIPDKGDGATDIRRWLKNNQIGAVSIWGIPLYDNSGDVIIDYKLRSVDFVPPHSEGQKNEVIIGEMENFGYSELEKKLSEAVDKKYNGYIFVPEFYSDYLIAEHSGKFYKIPYEIKDDDVILGTAEKVRRIIEYKPVGVKMEKVTNDELLSELKKRTSDGRISIEKAVGEMGVKIEDSEKIKSLEEAKAELDNFKKAAESLGLKLDEVLQTVKKTKEDEKKEADKKELIQKVEAVKKEKGLTKDGKATGEMSVMVDKFARFEIGMSYEQVAGEMDRVINDADIQKMVQAKNVADPVSAGNSFVNGQEKKVYTI